MKIIKFSRFLRVTLRFAVVATFCHFIFVRYFGYGNYDFYTYTLSEKWSFEMPVYLTGYYSLISTFIGTLILGGLIYLFYRSGCDNEKKEDMGVILYYILFLISCVSLIIAAWTALDKLPLVILEILGVIMFFVLAESDIRVRDYYILTFPTMFPFLLVYSLFLKSPLIHSIGFGIIGGVAFTLLAFIGVPIARFIVFTVKAIFSSDTWKTIVKGLAKFFETLYNLTLKKLIKSLFS